MKVAPTILLGLAASLAAASADAAGCSQERAIYTDESGTYSLTFEAVDPDSSAASHRFKIAIKGSDALLDGYVMPSEPVDRTNGMLFYNCPEGDATGDEIAACTVWEGVIYASLSGKIALLPQQGEEAAQQLLLPGFGPALRHSRAWEQGKASVVPWDVMQFKGCSQ